MKPAYYNENDPFAAAWLASLIAAGHIAPGDVDTRSIVDVAADDLVGYGQAHFFAGIGGWSLALRLAGIPDDEPIWTGSCPCQGLSVAGKRGMRTDDWTRLRADSPDPVVDARHLWPAFQRLIRERAPSVVVGEQTASADGRTWLSAVRADLEALGYAVGAADLCAAGFGAPHVRQRLWWGGVRVADAKRIRLRGQGPGAAGAASSGVRRETREQRLRADAGAGSATAGGLGHAHGEPRDEGCPAGAGRDHGGDAEPRPGLGGPGLACGLGDPGSAGLQVGEREDVRGAGRRGEGGAVVEPGEAPSGLRRPGSLDVDWRDADWLRCRDGRWRPVEPGTSPLATGVSNRVGRLRGYGNAIVTKVGATFVISLLEAAQESA